MKKLSHVNADGAVGESQLHDKSDKTDSLKATKMLCAQTSKNNLRCRRIGKKKKMLNNFRDIVQRTIVRRQRRRPTRGRGAARHGRDISQLLAYDCTVTCRRFVCRLIINKHFIEAQSKKKAETIIEFHIEPVESIGELSICAVGGVQAAAGGGRRAAAGDEYITK